MKPIPSMSNTVPAQIPVVTGEYQKFQLISGEMAVNMISSGIIFAHVHQYNKGKSARLRSESEGYQYSDRNQRGR